MVAPFYTLQILDSSNDDITQGDQQAQRRMGVVNGNVETSINRSTDVGIQCPIRYTIAIEGIGFSCSLPGDDT